MRCNEILCEATDLVPAFRGVPQDATDGFDVSYGTFFTDSPTIASRYAGPTGRVIEVRLDLSNALRWTAATSAEFQNYVSDCWIRHRIHGDSLPRGVRQGLLRHNRAWGVTATLPEAVGSLLRMQPEQVGDTELDRLMGFVKAFIGSRDVVIRDHETGAGQKNGLEYIVFSKRRIKPVVHPA